MPEAMTVDHQPAQMPLHEGSDVALSAGDFTLAEKLGEGGMAIVYRAKDPQFQRHLAVKVMKSAMSVDRFQAESDLTARLQHPGIPPVHSRGVLADGRPFLVMKLIEGHTLSELLKSRSSLSDGLARWLQIFEQVCQTVGYAHSLGVIHRDLKPLNVMVGAFGEVQVMDWGLTKDLNETPVLQAASRTIPSEMIESAGDAETDDATRPWIEAETPIGTHGAVGTYKYMAPEQARAEWNLVDTRADVFGLGAMLCEILTGDPPYLGTKSRQLASQAARAELTEVMQRLHLFSLDPELISITERCLQPLRENRPTDGRAVAELMVGYRTTMEARLRQTQAEQAANEARQVELRKRRRTQLALAVSIGILVLGAIGFGWWAERRAEADRLQQASDEITRKQSELELTQAKLASQLNSHQEAIRLAMQRGEVQTAIQVFDAAVAAGLPVTPEMRLSKARALALALRVPDSESELAQMDQLSLTASQQAKKDLLRGALMLGTPAEERGIDHIRRALGNDKELPEAERDYARGLVSETTIESIDHLRNSIRLDPSHFEARAVLGVALFTLGRLEELIRHAEASKVLAPRHSIFALLLAMAHGLGENRVEATRYVEELRSMASDPAEFEICQAVMDVLPEVRGMFRHSLGGGSQPNIFKVANFFNVLLPKIVQRVASPGTNSAIFWGLRMPPAIRRGLLLIVVEMDGFKAGGTGKHHPLLQRIVGDNKSVLRFTDAASEAIALQRLKDFPEGTLALIFAFRKLDQAWQAQGGNRPDWRDRMAEAAKAMEQAADTPGLFGTNAVALDLAIALNAQAGFDKPGAPARPEFTRRSAELLRRRMLMTEPITPNVWSNHTYAARDSRDFHLARICLEEWKSRTPNDPNIALTELWIEYLDGRYSIALIAAEQLLAKGENPTASELRDRCREKLALPPILPMPRVIKK